MVRASVSDSGTPSPTDPPLSDSAGGARPKRRPRYKGTHPRRFEEKYKELRPDAYPAEVEKVKARGSTPAGMHLPIMLGEIVAALAPLEGATILDCTLGWGGHAEALARAAGANGRVIGLDRDGEELARTLTRLTAAGVAVTGRHTNFAGAAGALRELGIDGADALLADLGVSSMQLDRPDRGLSFKNDGPLDMRMDRSRGETAADWIARIAAGPDGTKELTEVLTEFGDEPDAARIAARLVQDVGAGRSPRTTQDLADVVQIAKGGAPGRHRKEDAFAAHPATRSFQAIRIAVNREREALAQLLRDLPWIVRPGGRVAILTFHSGEERLVGRSLAAQAVQGLWTAAPTEPRRASVGEVRVNPRARSARLWTAIRADPAT